LLLCGTTRCLLQVDVLTGLATELVTTQASERVEDCSFGPDDGGVAAAVMGSRLLIFDTHSHALLATCAAGDEAATLTSCALSPRRWREARAAAAVDVSGVLSLWLVPQAERLACMTAIASPRCCCCFAGATTLVLGDNAGLRVWRVEQSAGALDGAAPAGCFGGAGAVRLLCCDSVGATRVLAVPEGDGGTKPMLWDALACALLSTLPAHEAMCRAASFSSSGQLLATLCGRDSLRLFETHRGTLLHAVRHGGTQFVVSIGLGETDPATASSREAHALWIVGAGSHRSATELWAQQLPPLPVSRRDTESETMDGRV